MKIKIIFIMFLLGFISCNEDEFLKETPKDDIFAENLFVNYDGFTNGLNGLYALVRKETAGSDNLTFFTKIGVDNGFSSQVNGNTTPLNNYNYMNSNNSNASEYYSWFYTVINTTNTIINRAEGDVNWQGGNEEGNLINKNKVIAHARLVRAWAYRHLTGCWGAVPLSTEEINGASYRSDWERTPVADIQKLMEEDWTFARDNLNMVEMTGFANSAVASHYLAELYLTEGKYSAAETEAKKVINNDEYHLMTKRFGTADNIPNPPPLGEGVVFMDLFSNPSREDGNMEVLWTFNNAQESVIGSVEGGNKTIWQAYATKAKTLKKFDLGIFYRYNGGRGRSRCNISDAALSWYEPTDDRFSEYAIKKYYIYPQNEAAETDFVTVESTKIVFKTQNELLDNFLWPYTRKYEFVDPVVPANSDRPYSGKSEMYLRLAETYLVLAEALYKDNKVQEAANYINEIRLRSNASIITASDVNIEFILKERSRELATEEHRRYVLNRNNLFYEWTVKYNPIFKGLGGVNIYPYNNLLPIPQDVIDANTGALMEQNPGYN